MMTLLVCFGALAFALLSGYLLAPPIIRMLGAIDTALRPRPSSLAVRRPVASPSVMMFGGVPALASFALLATLTVNSINIDARNDARLSGIHG
jgi:hypothetical protein